MIYLRYHEPKPVKTPTLKLLCILTSLFTLHKQLTELFSSLSLSASPPSPVLLRTQDWPGKMSPRGGGVIWVIVHQYYGVLPMLLPEHYLGTLHARTINLVIFVTNGNYTMHILMGIDWYINLFGRDSCDG